jgi:carbon monoxide dehydrogenase subunit G
MELEHSFTVPVPEERAWEVLLDVERVAPCMPGASLDSVDGDAIAGRIKVKVGPIAMTYAGTARFTERDPHARVVTLEASGKETRGAGTASATVRSMLEGQGDHTHVIVHTTLNVTGRPAQFGRGVMAEIGGKLIGIFAANLADMLAAGDSPAAAGGPAAAAAARDSGAITGGSSAGAGQQAAGPEPVLAGREPVPAGPEGAADRPADALAQPVEELQLSLRSYNSLRREGIHTVADLASRTREDLLAIDNIGPASVEEIRQKLAALGVSLSESAASANGLSRSNQETTGQLPPSGQPRPGTAPPGRPGIDARPPDEDAIDLLSVAGVPVLKRAVPAAAALLLAVLVVLGLRRRRSRHG